MTNEDVNFRFHQLLVNFSDIVNNDKFQKRHPRREDEDVLDYVDSRHQIYPLERYLGISPEKRRLNFYQDVDVTERIVLGKVTNIYDTAIVVVLLAFVDGQNKWIRDLKITASLDLPSERKRQDRNDHIEDIEIGDIVKAIICNIEDDKIQLSFDDKLLNAKQTNYFPLGKIDKEEITSILYESDDDENVGYYDEDKSFLKDIRTTTLFLNPNTVQNLVQYLGIQTDHESFFPVRERVKMKEDVGKLRDKQSFKWSMDMVGVGVKHFREGEKKAAIECFDQAITFYQNNVEAYVARGALKANNNDLKAAVDDFKSALRINPKHRNGRKYLIETLKSMAKGFEKEFKWKDASKCYKDILDTDENDEDAKERARQIKQMLSQKIVSGTSLQQRKVSSSHEPDGLHKKLSGSTKDRISKLKQLLEAESKNSETSSSSLSSSSSSSSSESEDSSDKWVEKECGKRKRKSRDQRHNKQKIKSRGADELKESKHGEERVQRIHHKKQTMDSINSPPSQSKERYPKGNDAKQIENVSYVVGDTVAESLRKIRELTSKIDEKYKEISSQVTYKHDQDISGYPSEITLENFSKELHCNDSGSIRRNFNSKEDQDPRSSDPIVTNIKSLSHGDERMKLSAYTSSSSKSEPGGNELQSKLTHFSSERLNLVSTLLQTKATSNDKDEGKYENEHKLSKRRSKDYRKRHTSRSGYERDSLRHSKERKL